MWQIKETLAKIAYDQDARQIVDLSSICVSTRSKQGIGGYSK